MTWVIRVAFCPCIASAAVAASVTTPKLMVAMSGAALTGLAIGRQVQRRALGHGLDGQGRAAVRLGDWAMAVVVSRPDAIMTPPRARARERVLILVSVT